MSEGFILAVPSKGRMMELVSEAFRTAGLAITKNGDERGYSGTVAALPSLEVAFLSASEIASRIHRGAVHMGVTGEDLIREKIADTEKHVDFVKGLGFGVADVVVAVPECWIDVDQVSDLEDVAEAFRRNHGRRVRVATKYMNLTRRFFAAKGITSYRIVESLGATEGTPASGAAELIVDITSTGATLRANGLKVLADGIILRSQASLVAARNASWTPGLNEIRNEIIAKFTA